MSLKMDLYVIFKTIKSVLVSEGYTSNKTTIKQEIDELRDQHKKTKK